MTAIVDVTKDSDVRRLARKSDILAGREIYKSGEVMLGTIQPDKVEAKVKVPGITTRTTLLEIQNGKLRWKCTCTSDTKQFCEHLVAAVLQIQKETNGDIYKAAGLLVKDRKVLAERSMGKPVFVQPGGRIEPGETPKEALVRELKEELGIDVDEADLESFGSFSAEAANHPGQKVHMETFLVKKWRGEIRPGSEVEELLWFNSGIQKDVQIGSIFVHDILPRLKERDLID
jgi:8-oxo-dGTP diphosphatase